jgi:hypothetical protein
MPKGGSSKSGDRLMVWLTGGQPKGGQRRSCGIIGCLPNGVDNLRNEKIRVDSLKGNSPLVERKRLDSL